MNNGGERYCKTRNCILFIAIKLLRMRLNSYAVPIISFGARKNAVVRISDLNGKVFYTRFLDLSSPGFIDLPAHNLGKGNYIVEIATGDFKKSFTVMKQ